jgi:hypothetical protein
MAPSMKSKSVAISTSYLNLSTLSSRQTPPGTAAYLPSVKPIHEHGVYSLRAVNPINIKF